jgi:hypothetical protein
VSFSGSRTCKWHYVPPLLPYSFVRPLLWTTPFLHEMPALTRASQMHAENLQNVIQVHAGVTSAFIIIILSISRTAPRALMLIQAHTRHSRSEPIFSKLLFSTFSHLLMREVGTPKVSHVAWIHGSRQRLKVEQRRAYLGIEK